MWFVLFDSRVKLGVQAESALSIWKMPKTEYFVSWMFKYLDKCQLHNKHAGFLVGSQPFDLICEPMWQPSSGVKVSSKRNCEEINGFWEN